MRFDRECLPMKGWHSYRKLNETRAVRINGPFEVTTTHGTVLCRDGYLAVDAHGYPYPISVEEFERAYESAA